ncbi:hypothetical protein [Streptomyces shenzhenensis]|uniref:ATP-binding protein n=1 Tax=Streptomyces sp. R39 TaxID=3238631 RepID=A0AB39QKF2_9ACTN|nr:hypothetical protein [Streptomyces shenzhenensis]
MKSLKAAAVVAGSLVVAGAAAPAFAVDAPSGLNGTVKSVTQGVDGIGVTKNSPVNRTLQGATGALNGQKPLVGGLPLGG